MDNLKKNPAFKMGCIVITVILVLSSLVIAPPEGLAPEGWTMLAIVIGAMILFISEAIPLAATCCHEIYGGHAVEDDSADGLLQYGILLHGRVWHRRCAAKHKSGRDSFKGFVPCGKGGFTENDQCRVLAVRHYLHFRIGWSGSDCGSGSGDGCCQSIR